MSDQMIGKIEREFQMRKVDVFLIQSAEAGAGPEGKKWLKRHAKYRHQWEKSGWVPNTGLTGDHLRSLEIDVNGDTMKAAHRVRNKGSAAASSDTPEHALRRQARARVIIRAYRSTLAAPAALVKPVTAGPTPRGPSFSPAPIHNPPSSPSTLAILNPAPTPLPFPPPPTPTDSRPTLTRTQPTIYPTIDNPAPIHNPPSSPPTLVILNPAPTPLPFPPPPTPTDSRPTLTRTQPTIYPTIDNPAPIHNPPSSPPTLVILAPAPTPLPFPPPPTPTDDRPTLTRTQPSIYPTIDNPAPDFFPLATSPPPYFPLLTNDNDFPPPPPDLNAQIRQLHHQLQLVTLQAPVVHIPENNLDPGSTVCVTWKNRGEDDAERGPERQGTPPGRTNPAPQMTRREGVRGPLGAIALKPPTQGNRANPQAAAPPRVNHQGGPKYTMGTGVFPHDEEQGVPQTPPPWLHQALPARPNCGRTPTPYEEEEELTTEIIEREEKPAGTVPYKALYPYKSQTPLTLTIQTNDVVLVDEDEVGEEGWLYGNKEGKMGWVPGNYVAKIETRLPPPPPLPTTQRGRSPTRRATRQKQAPDTHYMAPLMDQGGNQDPVYTPWCHRDMKYLYTSLPPIAGGANAWIRGLENGSVADNLAMGDVRAILTKSTSVPATRQIEHAAGTSHLPDDHPFDPHRPRYWEAIRAAYPTRNAATCVAGLERKPGENGHAYITRARTMWADGFGNPPEPGSTEEMMLRLAIIKGLPTECQTRLEDVVSLAGLDPGPWQETVCHAIEREQKNEKLTEEKGRETQRRLVEMQLQEVTKRLNDEKKADKEKLKVASILNVSEAQQPQPRPAPQDQQQQDTQRHHVPDYQQPRSAPRGYQKNLRRGAYQTRPEEYQGRDRQRREQDNTRACFFCESPDHWVRDCREYSNYRAGRQGTQRPPHPQPQQKTITNAICPLYGED